MLRIAAAIVGGLLLIVVLVALVNEYILSPQREVASVAGESITLQEWQERVRFERAQRIVTLEDQLEMLNNDVGMVQQFSGQTINELQSYEGLAEATLNRMAQDRIILQALEERGIEITDEEIDRRIEEAYNFFGGESPTPFPTPTQAPDPTPSLTPVGAEAAEQESTVEPPPTSEPFPTATPVSEESFQQEFGDLMDRYRAFGVDEEAYRTLVAGSIAGERLLDILAEEQGLAEEDIHASAFILNFPTDKEAEAALSNIEETGFLAVWNSIRSNPPEQEDEEDAFPASATEILWQTRDAMAGSLSPEEVDAIFNTPVDEPSGILEITGSDGEPRYVIVMPSGREMRPLSSNELRGRKIQLLSEYIDEATSSDVEIGEFWRSRVPKRPILDPKFLQGPTPTPPLPEDPAAATE